MVQGYFSFYDLGPIYNIPGIMDYNDYLNSLTNVMMPHSKEMSVK